MVIKQLFQKRPLCKKLQIAKRPKIKKLFFGLMKVGTFVQINNNSITNTTIHNSNKNIPIIHKYIHTYIRI